MRTFKIAAANALSILLADNLGMLIRIIIPKGFDAQLPEPCVLQSVPPRALPDQMRSKLQVSCPIGCLPRLGTITAKTAPFEAGLLQRLYRGRCQTLRTAVPTEQATNGHRAQGSETTKKQQRVHRLEQTPEERKSKRPPILDHAENSLAEYCSSLPGEGADSEHCWVAYDYFERRKDEAESGCEINYETGSKHGEECAKMESFESFVRQLLGASPMSSFAHLLYTLRKAEMRDESQPTGKLEDAEIRKVQDPAGETHFELSNVPDNGKDRLIALFHAMDRDGNGRLDTGEFRDAMNKLGMAHLTGTTVSTIFTAMDIHGPIDLEDFLHIVEAEEIYSDTPISRWLRAKRGESKYWGSPIESL